MTSRLIPENMLADLVAAQRHLQDAAINLVAARMDLVRYFDGELNVSPLEHEFEVLRDSHDAITTFLNKIRKATQDGEDEGR